MPFAAIASATGQYARCTCESMIGGDRCVWSSAGADGVALQPTSTASATHLTRSVRPKRVRRSSGADETAVAKLAELSDDRAGLELLAEAGLGVEDRLPSRVCKCV